ncbi:MAG TPA: phosphatase PAP2 family protein [Candidatus Nocardiopsis merdipullorum]|nr:phosphatase PAP2 family protein [Candidatus Nocardiopsis merdipullorum]
MTDSSWIRHTRSHPTTTPHDGQRRTPAPGPYSGPIPVVRTTEFAPGPPAVRAVKWPSVSEIAWGLASDRIAIMLAVALIMMTMLGAGPLHPVDNFLNEIHRPYWEVLREPLIYWPDNVASRYVALPVLGVVALQLAYWHRSWRPIVLGAVGVVGMMSLVSIMKLAINRGHAKYYTPEFFEGPGNVAFPSGHGANAILIYGLVLFLIIRFGAARPHIIRRLAFCIVGIALLQSAVSIYLHFHWFSDLVTGMVAGGLALRLTVRLDRMIPHGRTVEWWPWYGRKGPLQ